MIGPEMHIRTLGVNGVEPVGFNTNPKALAEKLKIIYEQNLASLKSTIRPTIWRKNPADILKK